MKGDSMKSCPDRENLHVVARMCACDVAARHDLAQMDASQNDEAMQ